MNAGKVSVLGSVTQLKKKKEVFYVQYVGERTYLWGEDWGYLRNYQFIEEKNQYLISMENAHIE